MRVLMLNDLPVDAGPGRGGAEVVVTRLMGALRRQGHEVRLHSRRGPRSGMSKVGALWDPVEARRVRALVRDYRPDVVHVHNVLRELSPAVLWAVRRWPVVMTVHDLRVASVVLGQRSLPERWLDALVKQPLDARVVRRVVDSFVTVGPAAAEVLAAAGFGPVTVIPPPGPTWTASRRPPSTCDDIAFVGRLAPDKGAGVLLEAFAGLAAPRRGRLLVAGDGPSRGELEAVAGADVTFLGALRPEDLERLLGDVRLLVVPSLPALRPETSSLTTIEAAWMGRPVIGSDDPAVATLVRALEAGVVVPAGDVQALTAALTELLQDDARVDRLGESGALAAHRDHAPDRIAERYLAVYAGAQ